MCILSQERSRYPSCIMDHHMNSRADLMKNKIRSLTTYLSENTLRQHSKGIADWIGGKAKSLVQTQVDVKFSTNCSEFNRFCKYSEKQMLKSKVIMETYIVRKVSIPSLKSIHVKKDVRIKVSLLFSEKIQVCLNEKSGSYNQDVWVFIIY